ncbi:uncharacterized protein B0I36DRAFT_240215 [Microdochium trichocladiopsis]|uniref:F-box domain-containing protein n=1 Tax=Microdochium trichocladiopsis TaxID=1682393 RepID=A0A9P8YDU5_9PEZI|nr:uncharacterized protein B0I36DRAFT_240215 [Microdochium trichocladiopsis]KAH7035097.1 hypothetical protein B0I36DRAFT_240215 [Microdochium trichocladiopsis]
MSDADGRPSTVAFNRLPDEIIEQILLLTEPNSFASLILLNSNWRRVSQQAHLYAHHLALCPATYGNKLSPSSVTDDDLPRLRRLFSQQIKRNLFDAYVRPKVTHITLISNAISSSSAPGGDGLQFSHSLRGHHLLAYNSSRIYVLDVQGPKVEAKREFKILRRPAAVCIVDDGSLLAVLSTDMQIELYDLSQTPPRRKQSLILDHLPRAIALSPCGSVLAAAYQGGIEVQSIAPGALPTERRAVKCDAVDSLAFSFDGTQLLGTTSTSQPPNTVILTAPYYDPGSQMLESNVSAMWTTSILFPNTSRDCSHAVLLQETSSVEAEWSFTYDRSFETFRAVRIDDLRNGTTYFPGPVPNVDTTGALIPSTLPAANLGGQLVSAGFESKDVWVYGVPEDLEAVPEPAAGSASTGGGGLTRGLSNRSTSRQQEGTLDRVPQWQVLCDKLRNNFVYGRKVVELEGLGSMKWVSRSPGSGLLERLVVCAKGAQPAKPITEEDDMNAVDGGRVTIIDFDYSPNHGSTEEITIDVGTPQAEILEEEQRDLATEVAIVRRRTVAQQRGGRGGAAARAAIAARHANNNNLVPPLPKREQDEEDPLLPRRMATARDRAPPREQEDIEDATLEEVQEALDAPYGHADPRSVTSLRRAATAAAMSRRRVPQAAAAGPVEYRRADGRREHPHESDADNWVPPPPPYSKDDPVDLPAFLRNAAIPGAAVDEDPVQSQQQSSIPAVPPLPRTASVASRHDLPRLRTSPPPTQRRISLVDQSYSMTSVSAVTTAASTHSSSGSGPADVPRHLPVLRTSQILTSRDGEEDLYDVSPPGSPQMAAVGISPQTTGHTSGSQPLTSISTNSTSQGNHNLPQQIPTLPGAREPEPEAQASPASRFRRLSNSLTWPRVPRSSQSQATSLTPTPKGYPYSAPPRTLDEEESLRSAPPPLPRPDQMFSLHNRQNSMPSRRASGMVQGPVTESTNSQIHSDQLDRQLPMLSALSISQQASTVPDQPLIISTPQGISGAFDTPDSQSSGRQRPQEGDTRIIHAPIARHPRPIPGSLTRESTAERLETIYSPRTMQESGTTGTQPLTASSLRYHTSMTRRESRARRSAARNMQDAKGRGWRSVSSVGGGKKKKGKSRKNNRGGGADDAASNGGWTDVTWASKAPRKGGPGGKSKKCIVM